jgi:hypothetical protein
MRPRYFINASRNPGASSVYLAILCGVFATFAVKPSGETAKRAKEDAKQRQGTGLVPIMQNGLVKYARLFWQNLGSFPEIAGGLKALSKQVGHLDKERPAIATQARLECSGESIKPVAINVVVIASVERRSRVWCISK